MPESSRGPRFVAVGGRRQPFLRRGAVAPRRKKPGRAIRISLVALVLAVAAVGLARFFGGSFFLLQRTQLSGTIRARTEEILRALEPSRCSNLVAPSLPGVSYADGVAPSVDRV